VKMEPGDPPLRGVSLLIDGALFGFPMIMALSNGVTFENFCIGFTFTVLWGVCLIGLMGSCRARKRGPAGSDQIDSDNNGVNEWQTD